PPLPEVAADACVCDEPVLPGPRAAGRHHAGAVPDALENRLTGLESRQETGQRPVSDSVLIGARGALDVDAAAAPALKQQPGSSGRHTFQSADEMNGASTVPGWPSSAPGVIWRTPSFLARSSIISL